MKSLFVLLTGASLATTLVSVPAPAAATTGEQATAICRARPGCRRTVGSNGDIVIITGEGRTVWCPNDEGDCVVVYRRPPPGQPPSVIRGLRAENVLGQRSAGGNQGTTTAAPRR